MKILKHVLQHLWFGLIALLCLGQFRPADAHPMGNFSINHYARLEAHADKVTLRYLLDFAEIPSIDEHSIMDADHNNKVSEPERKAYLRKRAGAFRDGLQITINGKLAPLSMRPVDLQFRPGAGGLDTIREAFVLSAPLPNRHAGANYRVEYKDTNFPQRTGWKEVIAVAGTGAILIRSSVPAQDKSKELTEYRVDPDIVPPQQTTASFTMMVGMTGTTASTSPPKVLASATSNSSNNRTPQSLFTQAIARPNLSFGEMLGGLLIALIFGALHALQPGHGKTMVAAYLVGSRGTPRHAALLGIVVTITHTFGVFLLGFVTLFASQYILPEQLYPWLSAISGFAICAVGIWLLISRLRGLGQPEHDHHHGHQHDHNHLHDHTHEHHDHVHEHPHQAHTHEHAGQLLVSHAEPAAHHHHDEHGSHEHPHSHDDEGHHTHTHHDHDHHHDHHHHGGHGHHHHVPEGPITAKTLIALGISGGIVPCPEALVVLLAAIKLQRIFYGMLLITAFSIGLAAALIAIGLLVV
ncbi:MAG: hypothetical protein JOZ57_11795, partial [Abitibacteriaceae bacterium]|nr:hypothetical protein [Abditibacteriaceae bacterium]